MVQQQYWAQLKAGAGSRCAAPGSKSRHYQRREAHRDFTIYTEP